jgi:hypothetical protein
VAEYRQELARYGLSEDTSLTAKVKEVWEAAQCTGLEGHLCRALKKESPAEIKDACGKYLDIFADVRPALVVPVLWEAARKAAGITETGA